MTRRSIPVLTFVLSLGLAACDSPESTRTRGGGPGADIGNRGDPVRMHEGSNPYEKTPKLISGEGAPLAGAHQARNTSSP